MKIAKRRHQTYRLFVRECVWFMGFKTFARSLYGSKLQAPKR